MTREHFLVVSIHRLLDAFAEAFYENQKKKEKTNAHTSLNNKISNTNLFIKFLSFIFFYFPSFIC